MRDLDRKPPNLELMKSIADASRRRTVSNPFLDVIGWHGNALRFKTNIGDKLLSLSLVRNIFRRLNILEFHNDGNSLSAIPGSSGVGSTAYVIESLDYSHLNALFYSDKTPGVLLDFFGWPTRESIMFSKNLTGRFLTTIIRLRLEKLAGVYSIPVGRNKYESLFRVPAHGRLIGTLGITRRRDAKRFLIEAFKLYEELRKNGQ